jgi:hypothetical protein
MLEVESKSVERITKGCNGVFLVLGYTYAQNIALLPMVRLPCNRRRILLCSVFMLNLVRKLSANELKMAPWQSCLRRLDSQTANLANYLENQSALHVHSVVYALPTVPQHIWARVDHSLAALGV